MFLTAVMPHIHTKEGLLLLSLEVVWSLLCWSNHIATQVIEVGRQIGFSFQIVQSNEYSISIQTQSLAPSTSSAQLLQQSLPRWSGGRFSAVKNRLSRLRNIKSFNIPSLYGVQV